MPDSLPDVPCLRAAPPGSDDPSPDGARPPGLRRHIVAIVLAALLPALFACGIAAWGAATSYQQAFEARLRDTARALAQAVDADLKGRVEALTAFATSDAFGDGRGIADVAAAHRHAGRVAAATGMRIAVADSAGRFLLHHQVPPGAPLPATGIAGVVLREAVVAARPVVSDLMPGPLVRRPVVAVVVPVPRTDGGPPVLATGGSLDPEYYDAMLARSGLEDGTAAGLIDAAGRVVARTDGRHRGATVPEADLRRLRDGPGQAFRRTGLDGTERLSAIAPVPSVAGWSIIVGAPYAAYRESWLRPVLGMTGGLALALVSAGGLSMILARRVLGPVRRLAEHARGLARDPEGGHATAAALPPVPVAELEALRRGLAAAEQALQQHRAAEREAFAALAEKEALLAGAQQLAGVGGWTLDLAEGGDPLAAPLRWTRESFRIFGLPPDGPQPGVEEVLAAIPPEDQAPLRAAMRQAARDGRPYRLEHRIRRPDGAVRLIEELGAPERDAAGRIHRITGSSQDVTERRMSEAALADNAARLHDLLATLDLAAFMARDPDGTIRFWSKGCERLYGWSAAQALGRNAHELLGTVFPEPLAEIEAVLERAGEWLGELRHRRRDGEEVVVAARKALRRDAAGRAVAVVESVADITPLQAAREALERSEARLRLALGSAGLGLWEQDFARGRICIDVRAAEVAGGLLPAERWVDFESPEYRAAIAAVHPEDAAALQAARAAFMAGQEGIHTIDFRLRAAGGWRWISFHGAVTERDPASGRARRALSVVRDITAAKEAERSLARSEALRRSVIDTALDAIVVAEEDGTIVSANRAAARIFGHPGPEALLGRDLGVLMPAGEAARHPGRLTGMASAPDARAMAPGRPLTGRRADRSEFPVEVSVAGFEADGRRFVTGILRDVSDRVAAQQALAESEARLRTIVETVPVGLVMAELPSGRIVGGNRHVEEMLRHPVLQSPDIHGYDEWVSFHADGTRVDGHEYPLARMVLAGEENPSIEVLYQRGDGTLAWTRIMGRPVRNAAGALVGGVVALVDVDGERRAREALAESEERLRTATENARVGLVVVDREHRYRFANRAYAEILRLPTHEIVGRRVAEVLPAVYAEQIRPRLERAFAGERVEYELQLPETAGQAEEHVAVTYEPGRGAAGDQVVVVVIADVTERVLAARAMAASEARLRDLLATLDLGSAMARDPDGTIRFWSKGCEQLYGWTAAEAVGRVSHELLGTVFPDSLAAVEAALAAEGAWTGDLRHRTRDGREVIVAAHMQRRDGEGASGVILEDVTDVTAERQAVAALATRTRHLAALVKVSDGLLLGETPEAMLQGSHAALAEALGVDMYFNYMVQEDGRDAWLELQGSAGLDAAERAAFHRLDIGQALCGTVAARRQPLVIETMQARDDALTEGARAIGLRAYAGFPLLAGDRLVGTLAVASRSRDAFTAEELGLVRAVADQAAVAVDRLLLQRAVRDSEARFRGTFEQAAVGIGHVGLDGAWLRVNGRLCAMLGYTEAELLATTFQDITHPDDLDADLDNVRRVLAGEIDSYGMEKRYIRKDGALLWIELTVSLRRDAAGAPLHFISVVQDIADRKAAEAALAESEWRYRSLFERMQEGFGLWEAVRDATGRVADLRLVERNDALDRLTDGALPPEVLGRTLRELFPGMAPHWLARYLEAAETGAARVYEDRSPVSDRWVNVRFYRPAPERLAVMVHDVSARIAAQAALRDSEAMLRRVLDNLFAFVGVLAPDGTLLDANRAPLEAAGITLEAVRGRPFWESYWWSHDPETAARVREACRQAAAGEPSRFDAEARMAGDSRMVIDFQVAPLRDDAGRVTHLIPSAVDITARKRTEEAKLLLAREVDHRAKNALAVVQSVLTLTRTEDPAAYKKAVMGRIAAMALAHTLLARERWNGADLRTLLAEEMAAYRGAGGADSAVLLEGPAVGLAPDAAQPVAMAVHELATNAAKYGALSVAGGRVVIRWAKDAATGGLALVWEEQGGPVPVPPNGRRGFGTSLIESTVVRQLQGELALDWGAPGLRCRVRLPAKQVVWPGRDAPAMR